MRADTLPTQQYSQKIRTVLWQSESLINKIPALQKEFKKLNTMAIKLFSAIIDEEKVRPELMIDVGLYDEKVTLEDKIEAERKRYSEEFEKHERDLTKLDTQLDDIHKKIIEKQGEEMLSELKKLVENNKLDLEIDTTIDKLNAIVSSESCIKRYMFCCFLSKEVKKAKNDIARLERERHKLDSTDPTHVHEVVIHLLEKKRNRLRHLRDDAIDKLPKKVENKSIDRSSEIDAMVSYAENRHNTAISNETLYHALCTYDRYHSFLQKLLVMQAEEKKLGEKVPLVNPLNELIKLFTDHENEIQKLFSLFWCPHSNNRTAMEVYQYFSSLSLTEQEKILNEGIVANLIPFEEIVSVDNTYHPLGVSKILPPQCPMLSR